MNIDQEVHRAVELATAEYPSEGPDAYREAKVLEERDRREFVHIVARLAGQVITDIHRIADALEMQSRPRSDLV